MLPQPSPQVFTKFEILGEGTEILTSLDYVISLEDSLEFSVQGDRAYNSRLWYGFGDNARTVTPVEVEGIILINPYSHAIATTRLAELAAAVAQAAQIRYGFFSRWITAGKSFTYSRVAAGFRVNMSFIPAEDVWRDAYGNERYVIG